MKSEPFDGRSAEMRQDSPWLASEDLMDINDQNAVVVEIEHVFHHKGATFDDGRKENVYALKFVNKEKQLILNATNRKKLVEMFGTTKTTEWIGRKITLYVADGIRKPGGARGETTTGIRIR